MTYPFVASAHDLGVAAGPRRAIIWHMAEGYGTVGYLSRPNPNGVSVHYVIERTGRIVQMLLENHMHSSIRVFSIRTSDDSDGFYGATAAKAVMGSWWQNPNHASIGVEAEGFASQGPNMSQRDAMERLWADVAHRHAGIRSLGHRDFASYKACPGRLIDWTSLGGHGRAPQEDDEDMDATRYKPVAVCDIRGGGALYADPDRRSIIASPWPGGTGIQLYALPVIPAIGGKAELAPIRYDSIGGPAEALVVAYVGADLISNVRLASSTVYSVTVKSDAPLTVTEA